jgi:probable F420-dependent oxidoreductase
MAMAAAQKTLAEAYPDRFLLGLGVSHAPLVEGLRGHRYERPLATMRAYLDAMDRAPYLPPPPSPEPPRVLAALAPKMLALAAERAWGSHPYLVPVEHTKYARGILGSGQLLAPEQAVVLERDAGRARAGARAHMAKVQGLTKKQNNIRRHGFGDPALAKGGSDRLVDAIVAWGDGDAIAARVRAHHAAGADHVCVQVLHEAEDELPLREWRELAPILLATG